MKLGMQHAMADKTKTKQNIYTGSATSKTVTALLSPIKKRAIVKILNKYFSFILCITSHTHYLLNLDK